jgi:hypothetical protein
VIYNCCWFSPPQSFLCPAGLMTIFYCLEFKAPPTWRARSLYLYPPGIGVLSFTPRHWVPFSSLPRTCRAMVEVFEPSSSRTWSKSKSKSKSKSLYDWRFTANQFVLAPSPLRFMMRFFFFNSTLAVIVLM